MAITNDKTMKIVNNSFYLYVAFMLLDFIHEICVILKITEPSLSAGFAAKRGKRIRDAALSTFIHHYTFAAKSKSIKYDSRRTI